MLRLFCQRKNGGSVYYWVLSTCFLFYILSISSWRMHMKRWRSNDKLLDSGSERHRRWRMRWMTCECYWMNKIVAIICWKRDSGNLIQNVNHCRRVLGRRNNPRIVWHVRKISSLRRSLRWNKIWRWVENVTNWNVIKQIICVNRLFDNYTVIYQTQCVVSKILE